MSGVRIALPSHDVFHKCFVSFRCPSEPANGRLASCTIEQNARLEDFKFFWFVVPFGAAPACRETIEHVFGIDRIYKGAEGDCGRSAGDHELFHNVGSLEWSSQRAAAVKIAAPASGSPLASIRHCPR